MKVEELTPLPAKKELFALRSERNIPVDSGCYVLTTFDNEILYIGLASNLRARFRSHLESPEKNSLTELGRATWFSFLLYSPDNLPKLERTWMHKYEGVHGELPALNKVHSPLA